MGHAAQYHGRRPVHRLGAAHRPHARVPVRGMPVRGMPVRGVPVRGMPQWPAALVLGALGRDEARRAAGALAAARTLLGVTALVLPRLPAGPWVGAGEARRTSVRLLARTLGGRDLALGLGALLVLAHDGEARRFVEAGALADGCDAAATLVAFKELPKTGRWLVLASTIGAAAVGALLAPLVDRP
ncbi:MAG: hypothetical protein ACYCTE_05750 [Acidimicrobiales bacterium]